MGRKSTYKIGDVYGKLKIKEIIPSNKRGMHVKLLCHCESCNSEKIMNGASLRKRVSCGCLQRESENWKRIGPKTMPWQLPFGEAAKNHIKYQYRNSAKKRNLEFSLPENHFEDLLIGKCYYCGSHRESIQKGQGKTSGNFPYTGIDRIDSNKGYTIENSVPCCWTCNNMKSNFSLDKFINQIKKIYEWKKIK